MNVMNQGLRGRNRRWHDGRMTKNVVSDVNGGAEAEVVGICRELLRIDTTNPGDHSGPGERRAAEYVAGLLGEVGLTPAVLESFPKRTSLVARVEGQDRTRPALLIHGHLDVVPANASDWQQDPFGGEIVNGCVWGRGAVDMKDMDAIMLAVVRQRMREGRKPARDIVLSFNADEEAGGVWFGGGRQWRLRMRKLLLLLDADDCVDLRRAAIDLELKETDAGKAKAALKEMCEKLLANTVIEKYEIELKS